MFWAQELVESARLERFVVNDSKTPSGRAHVGALRGVLIHDAVFRVARSLGKDAEYLFGVDDYDPLDELPAGDAERTREFLGRPLCDTPAPPGSAYSDMAEHYFQDFLTVFRELSVEVSIYRMRDVYRSGRFDVAIDRILRAAPRVREIYKEVSGSERSESWHPFQTVCENCGRVGTTEVVAYDGKEVEYHCRPKLVKWAQGCGHHGRRSPFAGGGKLPWKLEWVAKWATLGITIEGAGKDHTTRGGSRDVAVACFKAIFDKEAPLNIPYEFFLVGGAKMSSSKGLGASARAIADFLPPEILRFLILRTRPNRPVEFSIDERYVVKLYNEFDRLHERVRAGTATPDEQALYAVCEFGDRDYEPANFQLILALLQLPHVSFETHCERALGHAPSPEESKRLAARRASAEYWLKHYAQPEERTELQLTLPPSAAELSESQRVYLKRLGAKLAHTPWDPEALQAALFDVARATPIAASEAFKAIYVALLGKAFGPRAGNFLSFLAQDFVVDRFGSVPADEKRHFEQTARALSEVVARLKAITDITSIDVESIADLGVALRATRQAGTTDTHLVSLEAGVSLNDLLERARTAVAELKHAQA